MFVCASIHWEHTTPGPLPRSARDFAARAGFYVGAARGAKTQICGFAIFAQSFLPASGYMYIKKNAASVGQHVERTDKR